MERNGREKLGILALWHEVVERKIVRQSTVDIVKKYMPDDFRRLIEQPMPAAERSQP